MAKAEGSQFLKFLTAFAFDVADHGLHAKLLEVREVLSQQFDMGFQPGKGQGQGVAPIM